MDSFTQRLRTRLRTLSILLTVTTFIISPSLVSVQAATSSSNTNATSVILTINANQLISLLQTSGLSLTASTGKKYLATKFPKKFGGMVIEFPTGKTMKIYSVSSTTLKGTLLGTPSQLFTRLLVANVPETFPAPTPVTQSPTSITPTPITAPAPTTPVVVTPAPIPQTPTPPPTPVAPVIQTPVPTTPVSETLMDDKSSGIDTTESFTVTKDWYLGWDYDCSNFSDGTGNFSIDVESVDGSFSGIEGVNKLGSSDSGNEHYYTPGTYYLNVDSECSWHVWATQYN